MTCPACEGPAIKAIYMGLPVKLCADHDGCAYLFGFWSDVVPWLPIPSEDEYGNPAFAFMTYQGAYLPALWHWLTANG